MDDRVRQFGRWWVGQLRTLVLSLARSTPDGSTDGLLLDLADVAPNATAGQLPATMGLSRRRGRQVEPLGRIAIADLPAPPGARSGTPAAAHPSPAPAAQQEGAATLRRALEAAGGRLAVRVPASWLLHHELALPLAAEGSLPQVLRHELGRVTPFSEAEILWDHGVAARDPARGRLVVWLVLGLRSVLDPVLAALAAQGAVPMQIEPAGPGAALRLRPAHRGGGTVARGLALACAALALAVLLLPPVRQSLALRAAERRIAALQPAVDRVQALRRRLAGEGAAGQAIAAETARVGSALGTLATLTTLLPDGTYLTTLTLQARQLTIEGRSTEAAGLIARLSADPTLHGVEFASPITHAEGGDAFTLRAQVEPPIGAPANAHGGVPGGGAPGPAGG